MESIKPQTGKLWDELTDDQKDEVLLSFEESADENNLIEADKIFKPR
ncbi:hypothetical protein BDD43_3496 [Mucilaginibacter gracilis]|uniref:Uncharacterized protein n=1 Tax=Mucilaginibacter gracilis TaxID=423350 RepID=A0A495J3W6_9SPHI|nr:hypothetical protein [Mucilaginibacter gracilis]RKR83292.1 hypothetical protein BDD43_3496 [Mucilaginibacter gracilis]